VPRFARRPPVATRLVRPVDAPAAPHPHLRLVARDLVLIQLIEAKGASGKKHLISGGVDELNAKAIEPHCCAPSAFVGAARRASRASPTRRPILIRESYLRSG
jgi:hypothetical protein